MFNHCSILAARDLISIEQFTLVELDSLNLNVNKFKYNVMQYNIFFKVIFTYSTKHVNDKLPRQLPNLSQPYRQPLTLPERLYPIILTLAVLEWLKEECQPLNNKHKKNIIALCLPSVLKLPAGKVKIGNSVI